MLAGLFWRSPERFFEVRRNGVGVPEFLPQPAGLPQRRFYLFLVA
jgi:hypothetical protein